MKRSTKLLSIALVSCAVSTGAWAAAERQLAMAVSVAPHGERAGAYLATVEVSDAVNGELLSAPQLVFLAGGENVARSSLESGEQIVFAVQVDESAKKVTYKLSSIRDGHETTAQQATIALTR